MRTKQLFFVLLIAIISFCCFGFMFTNFDRLSRYPYEDEESRTLINQYLNDKEIEYIIEYAIAPEEFIDYIEYDNFNIYQCDKYKELKNIAWYASDEDIVDLYYYSLDKMNFEDLKYYLSNYYISVLIQYLKFGDDYNENGLLAFNPNNPTCYIDDVYGVSIYDNSDLFVVDESYTSKTIKLSTKLENSLVNMASSISKDLGIDNFAGIVITEGYLSYYDIKNNISHSNFDPQLNEYPGHSEHQLGFAFDFELRNGQDLVSSKQYEWLLENSYKYGFIFSYTEDTYKDNGKLPRPNHLRYVGFDLAYTMHENNLTHKEALK